MKKTTVILTLFLSLACGTTAFAQDGYDNYAIENPELPGMNFLQSFLSGGLFSNDIEYEDPNTSLVDDSYSSGGPQFGGMFRRGSEMSTGVGSGFRNSIPLFGLPGEHGSSNDAEAPLGGGALLLLAFGTAYALKKNGRSSQTKD